MADTAAERASAVEQVMNVTANEPADVKKEALKAVAPPIPPPTGAVVSSLWKILVTGLLILAGLSVIGVLWAVLDTKDSTDADKVLIVFTPILSGLLGLFVTSPTQGGGNSNNNQP